MKIIITKANGKELLVTGVAGISIIEAGPVIVANNHNATEYRTIEARDLSIVDQSEQWPFPEVVLGRISRTSG